MVGRMQKKLPNNERRALVQIITYASVKLHAIKRLAKLKYARTVESLFKDRSIIHRSHTCMAGTEFFNKRFVI